MAQLTADKGRKYKVDNTDVRVDQPVDAATTIFAGSMVGLNGSTSYGRQLTGGDTFLGFADAQAANVANPSYPGLVTNGLLLGAAGALNASIRASGVLVVPLASVAGATGVTNVGQQVYATDGDTLVLLEDSSLVTVTGGPTGGTFTITVTTTAGAQTTSAIAYNATAATVQAALVALTNVNAGNATVTGSAGGPWTVQWGPGMTPTLATGTNSLTGGTSPALTYGSLTPVTSISKIGTIQNYLANTGNLEIFFQTAVRRVP